MMDMDELDDARAVETLIKQFYDWYDRLSSDTAGKSVNFDTISPVEKKLKDIGVPALAPLIASLGYSLISPYSENIGKALGRIFYVIGSPSVELLIAALKDKNSTIRAGAAQALGYRRDARAIEPLTAALDDEDNIVRFHANAGLHELGDKREVESLIEQLFGWYQSMDENTSDNHPDYNAISPAETKLKNIGIPAIAPLIASLARCGEYYRATAFERIFVSIGSPSVEPLIVALKDKDSLIRSDAAQLLGKLKDTRAAEPLIAALGDENNQVRVQAAYALGELGDKHAIEPLITAYGGEEYHGDAEFYFRSAISKALDQLHAPNNPARQSGYWVNDKRKT
jgi:HEAT repeat protein